LNYTRLKTAHPPELLNFHFAGQNTTNLVLMQFQRIRKNKYHFLVFFLFLPGAAFRVRVYQDGLSIGTANSAGLFKNPLGHRFRLAVSL
jgi:hypothetical protein